MKDLSELFWSSSLEDIKKGYIYNEADEAYTCLICGKSFTKGIVYFEDQIAYEAERFTRRHIEKEHVSMFDFLVGLDKKLTGLTDLQKSLLSCFYQGMSDGDIVKELHGGSTSTIRNHRFTLRERQKQAKIFLAIMELLEGKSQKGQSFINIPRTATMVDERYAITEDENEKILKTYFKEGVDGPLSEFPTKEKRKIAILKHIMKRFDVNKKYTEKEVNEVLKALYEDYVLLRRYLIEYGFMDRMKDCSLYWVKV